jgi:hypothetical protein
MKTPSPQTFIIDSPWCKAKVAAIETGRAEESGFNEEIGEPYASTVYVGKCPRCRSILAGESVQTDFEDINAYENRWSDVVRVYPKPPKTFSSYRIPRVVKDSLKEADRSLQANANIAACAMLGRALEALCRDVLDSELGGTDGASTNPTPTRPKKEVMLGEGIKKLYDRKVIDDRLYDWSQQLQAFRNLAAHPEDISISREDAEDLQTFVYAIVEYIYDLTDRYEEFKKRLDARSKRIKR